ncbi:MAG: hypothetical protein F4229_15200 [Gammaproteobacteria bacterium]|nr:hypothetical protein [Gammaproteobacteria bacterium]
MDAAPFAPGQERPVFFAMCGDDCELFFERDQFNEKQQAEHRENRDLTSLLQVALMFMGKPADHVALFDTFLEPRWRGLLDTFNGLYRNICGPVVPLEHCHFYPHESFYPRAAADRTLGALAGLYMISGSNKAVHQSDQHWLISQAVNSKMRLAQDAPAYGIPTPETLLTTKGDLGGPEANAFFTRHNRQLMLKIKGLAGARNVTPVQGVAECESYLDLFDAGTEVVLQERLDTDEWTEMTVDLTVSDSNIEITNVRRILFADGLWVGNYLRDDLPLSDRHREALLNVGAYVRSLGYRAPEGLNCGIDYFTNGDDIRIIETNARWTGGLFPAWMRKRLKLGNRPTVSFFDSISVDRLAEYQAFAEAHLHRPGEQPFSAVPLGFSPYTFTMDGRELLFIWQMVIGDLEAFKQAKHSVLGPGEMATADKITLDF